MALNYCPMITEYDCVCVYMYTLPSSAYQLAVMFAVFIGHLVCGCSREQEEKERGSGVSNVDLKPGPQTLSSYVRRSVINISILIIFPV